VGGKSSRRTIQKKERGCDKRGYKGNQEAYNRGGGGGEGGNVKDAILGPKAQLSLSNSGIGNEGIHRKRKRTGQGKAQAGEILALGRDCHAL